MEDEETKEPIPAEDSKPQEEQKEKSNEGIETIQTQLAEMQKRLDNQSRIIGKYENQQKKEEPEQKTEEKKEPETEASKFTALEEKIAALEAKNQAKLDSVKKAKIAQSILSNGGDADNANDYADYLAFKNKDKISVVENEIGEVSVTVKNGEEELSIGDWTRMFMSSDAGKFMISEKTGPSVKNKGKPSHSSSVTEVSSMEYSNKVAEINADRNLSADEKELKINSFKMK